MHWFWMNIPLATMIFAIWTGVPLWLVLKHPDTGPQARRPHTSPQARVPDTGPQAHIPDTPRLAQVAG
jgi:hypothetical protein